MTQNQSDDLTRKNQTDIEFDADRSPDGLLSAKPNISRGLHRIVLSAVLSALIYVFTLLSFPVWPGYVHLGDTFIFVACIILGPYAAIPTVIGSALADLTLGLPWWIPGTVVIKGLMAYICSLIIGKSTDRLKIFLGMLASSLFMQAGYLFYEMAMIWLGNTNFSSTVIELFFPIRLLINMLQTIVCVPAGFALAHALIRLNLLNVLRK